MKNDKPTAAQLAAKAKRHREVSEHTIKKIAAVAGGKATKAKLAQHECQVLLENFGGLLRQVEAYQKATPNALGFIQAQLTEVIDQFQHWSDNPKERKTQYQTLRFAVEQLSHIRGLLDVEQPGT